MDIRGVRDIQAIIIDLVKRCDDLDDALFSAVNNNNVNDEEVDDCVNDIIHERQWWQCLKGLEVSMLAAEDYYNKTIWDIEDNFKDEKDSQERLMFVVQKYFKAYLKTDLIPHIQIALIDSLRYAEINDYRLRELQMDIAKKMESIRDYYKQRYDLD